MFHLLYKRFTCLQVVEESIRWVQFLFYSRRLTKYGFLYVKINRHSTSAFNNTKLLESASTGIIIPRIMRKSNDKEEIERYRLMKTLCLEKNFNKAISQMKKWLEEPGTKNCKSTILTLNGLLYCLCENSKHKDIVLLKEIIDKHNISGDCTTYTVLIDSFGKTNNFKMVVKLFGEMTTMGLVPHERSYITATQLSLERNEFLKALKYFEKLESLQKERHDGFCAWFIASLSQAKQWQYVESIFKDFRDNQTKLGEETLAETRKYFESLQSTWKTTLTKVSPSGVCLECQQKLERPKFGKQEQHLESYFKYLINQKFVDKHDDTTSFCSNIATKDQKKVLRLIKYLKSNEPFDVIVDGLNVAMHPSQGLNFYHLYRLAEYFCEQDKRVLIMAANDLISPKKPNLMSVVEHEKAMRNLQQVSNIYLVKQNQSGIDDLFMIFATLYSSRNNTNIQLVSNDKFKDHRNKMKPQTARDFERWLCAHQVSIKSFDSTSGKPLIQDCQKYAIVCQNTQDSWHFPSTDDEMWLCIEQTSDPVR